MNLRNVAFSFNQTNFDHSETTPFWQFVADLERSTGEQANFVKAADVDGDGSVDLFGRDWGVFYGSGAKNRRLSRVIDGLGNALEIGYDGFGAYERNQSDPSLPSCQGAWPEVCLPKMRGLVSSHKEGFIEDNELKVRKSFGYHYVNARVNVTGHGFIGFDRRVISEGTPDPEPDQDPATASQPHVRSVTIDYEPIQRRKLNAVPDDTLPPYVYPLAGLPRTTTLDALVDQRAVAISPVPNPQGYLRRRTRITNTWQVRASLDGLFFPYVAARSTQVFDRAVPFTSPPTPDVVDGGSVTRCSETFTTDALGNVSHHANACYDSSDRFIEGHATTTVFRHDLENWFISHPRTRGTLSVRNGLASTRDFVFKYDHRGLLTSVTRGTLDEDNETPIDINAWHRTTFGLNDFGNPEYITEEVKTGEPSRTTTIHYEADQIYPWIIHNPLGHTTYMRFDERFGVPSTIIDPNDRIVQSGYDGLGLLAETRDPTGVTVRTYSPASLGVRTTAAGVVYPRIQVTSERQGVDGTRTGGSVVELDLLGRPVRIQSEGLGGTELIEERAYDYAGRLVGATLPHTQDTAVVPSERYRYDGLHRLTTVWHPDGSSAKHEHASVATLGEGYRHWLRELDCSSNPEIPRSSTGCPVFIERTTDEEGREDVVVTDHLDQVIRNVDGENAATTARFSDYSYGPFNLPYLAYQNRSTINDWDNPTLEYIRDGYGRPWVVRDGDTGISAQSFNGYDEQLTSVDPKGQLRLHAYDRLGRLVSTIDPAGISQWIYDQGENGIGRLSETISPSTSENPAGQRVRYTYEAYDASGNRGLLQRIDHVIDGVSFPIDIEYDGLGRADRVQYPARAGGAPIVAAYQHDASGILTDVQEVGSGTPRSLWHLDQAYQGHLIQKETFGNGATTTYAYDPERRWLESIQTKIGAETLQSLGYAHYANGQVSDRTQPNGTVHHDYDALSRLQSVTDYTGGGAGETTNYTYDIKGNLTAKGPTAITYLPAQPHLVDNVGDNTYAHDANGNVASRSGPDIPGGSQFFEYTPFDLPRTVNTGPSGTTIFDYSADEARVIRRDYDPANPTEDRTRIFVAGLYQREIDASGDTVEERFQISAGGRPVAEIVRTTSGDQTLYVHSDRLGSFDLISTNSSQTFAQQFDPFGAPDPENPSVTRSGFTGHQHDRDLGLIDMNGRVYDPLAGRFLTADPIVQAPFWSQGLNRYAYVFNDPINATDPSGFLTTSEGMGIGVLGTATAVIGYGIVTESLAGGFGMPALGGTPAGVAGPAAGATAGMSLGTTGLLWGRLMGSPEFHGPVANAAQVAPTTGTPTQGGGQSAASQNKGGIETGTSGAERSLERLDRGGDYSELPVQDDGNYLGQRPPPRRPRGAPMPGGGGGPVLRPAPRQYRVLPRPGSPQWIFERYPVDVQTRRTLQYATSFGSEREARALARTQLALLRQFFRWAQVGARGVRSWGTGSAQSTSERAFDAPRAA